MTRLPAQEDEDTDEESAEPVDGGPIQISTKKRVRKTNAKKQAQAAQQSAQKTVKRSDSVQKSSTYDTHMTDASTNQAKLQTKAEPELILDNTITKPNARAVQVSNAERFGQSLLNRFKIASPIDVTDDVTLEQENLIADYLLDLPEELRPTK